MKMLRALPALLTALVAAGCVVHTNGAYVGSTGTVLSPGGATNRGGAPVIQVLDYSPKSGIDKDGVITFTVVAMDPAGAPLQYNWSSTKGTLSATSGQTISWRPTDARGQFDPGLATVSLLVSSGGQATAGSVNIMIGERGAAEPQAAVPTPTPTVTPEPATPTPTATPSATPTPSMTPTPTPAVSATPDVFVTPTPGPTPSEGFEPVVVNTRSVQVQLRDDQIEDGDRIRVSLNGQVVAGYEDYTLTKAGRVLTLPLLAGENALKVTALNEGRLPPNTTEVTIDADAVVTGSAHQLSKGLKTGQSEELKFTVK